MGRLNLSAIRHRSRAVLTMDARRIRTPTWLPALTEVPISQILIRQQPVSHPVASTRTRTLPPPHQASSYYMPNTEQYDVLLKHGRRHNKRAKGKSSKLYKPVPMEFEEDQIRRMFYKDHPWELARPRVILEQTGDDSGHNSWDWSTGIEQPGKSLDGESVVHRTLHLLTTTPNTTLAESYTTARREFYDRRHQEDITRRVAAEEATHTGAVYPDRTNPILAGMAHEDRQHEEWRAWAVRERELRNQGRQRVGGAFGGRRRGGEEDEAVEDVNEGDDEESRRQLEALDEAPVATEGVQMAQAQRTAFSGGRV